MWKREGRLPIFSSSESMLLFLCGRQDSHGEREFLSRIVVGGRKAGANFPGGGPKIIGKRGGKKREKNWRWGRSNATSTLHFLAPSSPWSRRRGGKLFPHSPRLSISPFVRPMVRLFYGPSHHDVREFLFNGGLLLYIFLRSSFFEISGSL